MAEDPNKPKADAKNTGQSKADAVNPGTTTGAQTGTTAATAPTAAGPVDLIKVIPELRKQQEELQILVNGLQAKIHMLEQAFHENDQLRNECAKLIQELKALESDDWTRKESFFPDIYLSYRIKLSEKLKK